MLSSLGKCDKKFESSVREALPLIEVWVIVAHVELPRRSMTMSNIHQGGHTFVGGATRLIYPLLYCLPMS